MTTRFLIVRHGQTEWNVAGRIQGHRDSPLTPAGRAQARAVAARLAGEPLVAIYSSDLGRTRDTAAPTAHALGVTVLTDERLRERALGVFEGLTFTEAEERFPVRFARYKQRDPHEDMETGESLLRMRDRVEAVLRDIAGRHAGGTVLVVTHGGVLDQVHRIATGMTVEAARTFEIENASLNHLHWTAGRLVLDHWGDVSHHAGPETPAEF
ncbi:MAG: histidine phosphatase family protein [Burkholderiales bacterium]